MSDPAAVDDRPWGAFAVCAFGAVLPVLDVTKVYVIAPIMARSVEASPLAIQLAVAGYLLVFGLALIPAGRCGDLHSRRHAFIFGVALFALASLIVGVAPNEWILVSARLLQGIAAALILPQTIGMIQVLFHGDGRARAFGMLGAVLGLATTIAPGVAGLLVGALGPDLGWRASFLVNVPIALVALGTAIRLLPRGLQPANAVRDFDPVGTALLGLAICLALAPFVLTGGGADVPARWWLLLGVPMFAALFLRWERRYAAAGHVPLVDMGLFAIASFRNGVIITLFYFGSIPAMVFLAATFLQSGLGRTPFEAGIVTIAPAAAFALSSFAAGRLVPQFGRVLGVLGLALFGVGLLLTVAVADLAPTELTPWFMMPTLFVAGLGAGSFAPSNQILAMADVPVAQGGLAGSIQQVAQRFGTAIGLAVVTAIFAGVFVGSAGAGALEAGRQAFLGSVAVALLFIAVTLALVVADLSQRRKAA